MSLAEGLRLVVRGEVDSVPATLEKYSRDASLFRVVPEAVVRPLDAADVGALVKFVIKKKQIPKTNISITARAAGTDMSGGPLNDSIILDTMHLNKLLELTAESATVEPGMYFRDFDKETKKKNLELPSYTASREINAVGGMVANNSGGEKNLKYGKTDRYVEELDVVLGDGEVHTLKHVEGEALRAKLAEPGYEGDIYRKVAALVATPVHRRVIAEHKPQVEKNSSGYAIWDIGDGVKSLNLARLMVGAQGTLGIITKIKFKLVRPKPYAAMVVMFVKNLAELGYIVPEVLRHQPDSFESYDDHVILLTAKYFPELAVQMKTGLFGVALKFLPEVWMALTGGIPKIVLLVEFRGDTQEEALARAQKMAADISKKQGHIKISVMKNEQAARKYWIMRRETFNLLRKKVRGKKTAPFIDDFVVPPQTLPEFLPKLNAILAEYHFTYAVSGHVGDGNFHIFPLLDRNDPKMATLIDELSHKVYDLVVAYHGSITGEHNDGLVRTPYVGKMFGPEMLALFFEIKKIFDPHNIFNPGKKVGTTFSDALAKLDLPSVKKG